jgi:hypothetical protein
VSVAAVEKLGPADLGVSIRGGSAALVFVGLGLVIPWWAAGALAYGALLLAEYWVARHATPIPELTWIAVRDKAVPAPHRPDAGRVKVLYRHGQATPARANTFVGEGVIT